MRAERRRTRSNIYALLRMNNATPFIYIVFVYEYTRERVIVRKLIIYYTFLWSVALFRVSPVSVVRVIISIIHARTIDTIRAYLYYYQRRGIRDRPRPVCVCVYCFNVETINFSGSLNVVGCRSGTDALYTHTRKRSYRIRTHNITGA